MKLKSRTFVSLLCAAVLSLSAAAMPVKPGSIGSLTATAVSAAPKAPSSDYTGVVKDGGNSYYFENGVMLRNGWKTIIKNSDTYHKTREYYYADKDGKLTTFEFKRFTEKEKAEEINFYKKKTEKFDRLNLNTNYYKYEHKVGKEYLYINDNVLEGNDTDGIFYKLFPQEHKDVNYFIDGDDYRGIYKFDKDYYAISGFVYCLSNYASNKDRYGHNITRVYDAATGKKLYDLWDTISLFELNKSNSRGVIGLDLNTRTKVVTLEQGKEPSVKKVGKIIIDTAYFKTASSGQRESCKIRFINNTGKTIKDISFCVKFKTFEDKYVEDELTGKTTVTLKGVGPIGDRERQLYDWTDFMYFDSSKYNTYTYEIEIQSIKVVFTDGSSKIYKYPSDDITVLASKENKTYSNVIPK